MGLVPCISRNIEPKGVIGSDPRHNVLCSGIPSGSESQGYHSIINVTSY